MEVTNLAICVNNDPRFHPKHRCIASFRLSTNHYGLSSRENNTIEHRVLNLPLAASSSGRAQAERMFEWIVTRNAGTRLSYTPLVRMYIPRVDPRACDRLVGATNDRTIFHGGWLIKDSRKAKKNTEACVKKPSVLEDLLRCTSHVLLHPFLWPSAFPRHSP